MKINKHGYWEEICNHHTDKGLKDSLLSLVSDLESSSNFDADFGDIQFDDLT